MAGEWTFARAQADLFEAGNRAPAEVGGRFPDGRWPVSAEAWRERAREALSDASWGYLEGASGGEETMRANRRAFERWRLRPQLLRDVSRRDIGVEILGARLPAPFLLAPVGVQDAFHPDADLASARAAAACGVPMVVSTCAAVPMEAVAEAMGPAPRWYQLYPGRNRDITASMVARAAASGYGALVVTVDTPMLGWRERDMAAGFLPFLHGLGLGNYLADPAFRAGLSRPPDEDPQGAIRAFLAVFGNPALTWDDLAWIRGLWRGPLWLKGVTHPDDALRARDAGVDGVIVSNHGGRQVDGAVAALDALPAVRSAVGDALPLLLDSGVRRGADVLKAIALGARAVLIGRLYAYALAAAGEAGVRRVLDTLAADVHVTLGLCGLASIAQVDRSLVEPAPGA